MSFTAFTDVHNVRNLAKCESSLSACRTRVSALTIDLRCGAIAYANEATVWLWTSVTATEWQPFNLTSGQFMRLLNIHAAMISQWAWADDLTFIHEMKNSVVYFGCAHFIWKALKLQSCGAASNTLAAIHLNANRCVWRREKYRFPFSMAFRNWITR